MELEVWLDGKHVAMLSENRRQLTMVYTGEAHPIGAPLVSIAMPVSARRYPDTKVRAFFHGLLPEGEARRMLAYDFGLDESDDMGLLGALGKDCAGALVIQPKGDGAPLVVGASAKDAVDDAEIERRLRALPVHPLGVDGRIRVSLAGVQSKLLLARLDDGPWVLPADGIVSTHILKPEHRDLPNTVVNEAFCMNLAARSGLKAARTTISSFGGTEVLVSERYDRRREASGIRRMHQEDACQALSVLTIVPEHKYEEFGGPTLSGIARLLEQWGNAQSKEELLRQVVIHVIVGNADVHGKNVSFLHQEDGTVGLAPVYDIMSTEYYRAAHARPMSSTLGLFVNAKHNINEVTVADLLSEAERWGMRYGTAQSVLTQLLERLPNALDQAARDVPDVPQTLVDMVHKRITRARAEAARLGQ
ncbi:HipA domain-containing protein [Ferrimicrobium sp.]|uniref:HipA domain-containing protein n=1 Tax=Ferrimicrobium sp. TaxID=2926050 RepID=UPI00260E01F1|nr:HipA domain-containing protein [Ferrimicrobium sp.]